MLIMGVTTPDARGNTDYVATPNVVVSVVTFMMDSITHAHLRHLIKVATSII